MQISKRVAGFDDSQADSITRKVLAKKKKALLPMMIRCHIFGKKNCEGPEGWENDDHAPWYDPDAHYGKEIPGGLKNGYTEQEIRAYFDKIMGFASYAFNLSHAATYSYISMLTAYLKFYYPAQFMAAVLSMADEGKRPELISACLKMGLQIKVPDINYSKNDFTPKENTILYGLNSVKGVGAASIPDIISDAPYSSLEDIVERVPKKAFNKAVAESLAKCGALDRFTDKSITLENGIALKNRIAILNKLHTLRGDKEAKKNPRTGRKEILHENEDKYSEKTCMKYEEETLGTHLSVKTWWESIKDGQTVKVDATIKSVREHKDKKGGLMAFVFLKCFTGDVIDGVIFASKYSKLASVFYSRDGKNVTLSGKKSGDSSIIVNDALPLRSIQEAKTEAA